MLSLTAKIRTQLGKKSKKLRKEALLPAVLYGRKIKSTPISIGYKAFEKIYMEAGENTLVSLNFEGSGKEVPAENTVLIRDAMRHPLTRSFIHVDFYEVPMDEKINVTVPLVFVNESPAAKDGSAVLVRNIYELEVSALPKDLPREINIDVSRLEKVGDVVMLKDVILPASVEIDLAKDFVIAAAVTPQEEEVTEEKPAEETVAPADIKTEGEVKRAEKAAKEAEEKAE